MWKKISSKIIFTHPRITLVEDKVRLPSGCIIDYLKFANMGNVAMLICQREDKKILVQCEYAYPSNQNLFQFPGGLINPNEDIKTGANRELMEESKIKANNLKLLGKFLINNRRTDALVYVFLGTKLEKATLDSDPEEKIKNFWFSEKKINNMIKEGKIIETDALAGWAIYQSQK